MRQPNLLPQTLAWWALQTTSLLALLACTLLAYSSAGKIGRSSPYGTFLFVISLSFWSLMTGTLVYVTESGLGAWDGPPGWGDFFTIAGWTGLVAAFYLLHIRFPRPHGSSLSRTAKILVTPVLIGGITAAFAWHRVAGIGGVPDPEGTVRIVYFFLNGVMIAVFTVSFGLLHRLSHSTLGSLFRILGVALVLKSLGDLVFLIWPSDPPIGLLATALYPAAGLLAVTGLTIHHLSLRRLPAPALLADPNLLPSQLVLRDAALRLRGLAGELGEQIVHSTVRRVFSDAGKSMTTAKGVIYAMATKELWGRAVEESRERAEQAFGQAAGAIFSDVCRTYGVSSPQEVPPSR